MRKIPKLNLCCSTELSAGATAYVLVDKGNIVATNGHVLACIKTDEVFNSVFINNFPVDTFFVHYKEWKKLTRKVYDVEWQDNFIKTSHSSGGDIIPIVTKLNHIYPNWQKAIPDLDSDFMLTNIGMDVKLLYDLVQALPFPNEKVSLTFTGTKSAIIVRDTIKEFKSFGVIMPVLSDL